MVNLGIGMGETWILGFTFSQFILAEERELFEEFKECEMKLHSCD